MKSKYLAVGMIVAMLAMLGTSIAYVTYTTYRIETLLVDYAVAKDVIGLNVGTDALHFGSIPPGNSVRRTITLQSDRDTFVQIIASSKDRIMVSQNNFFMAKHTPTMVDITLQVPRNAATGTFKEAIRILFRRPR